jgi:glutamyl-tRNA synthetase
VLELLKVRARTTDDIVHQARPYLVDVVDYDADAVTKNWKDAATTRDVLQASRDALTSVASWEPHALEDSLRAVADARGVGAGKIFQPLRIALTGSAASPGMFDVLMILGRARSLQRIDASVRYITGAY